MRDELRIVRGAVATKDLVPVLTHFHLYDSSIQGGNGRIAIEVACDDLPDVWDMTVPADRFLKAVDACNGDPKLRKAEDNVLTVSRGRFRARLPLAPHDTYPRVTPADNWQPWAGIGKLLPVLRLLRGFIGTDASRPWATGVLFQDGYAWATNNVTLARVPINWAGMPHFMLPVEAVDELLRLGIEPTRFSLERGRITLELSPGTWVSAVLYDVQAPDLMRFEEKLESTGTKFTEIEELAIAAEKIAPFCADQKFPTVVFWDHGLTTPEGDYQASMEVDGTGKGRYHLEPFTAVLGVADWIDFSPYPQPVPWAGDGIEGLLMGLRI